MTEHTSFYNRLEALQQKVASTLSAVHSAADESDAQLKERIDRAQADLDSSVDDARQHVASASEGVHAKWAQLKADAAAKVSDVKANIDRRALLLDSKGAIKEADWAESDAAEALDFADWAVDNAELAILDAIHARAYADKLVKAAADA